MKVRVYWNLHKKCWSIMDAKTNRVIGHDSIVCLIDVEFVVRQAGNRKVREEGKKNVHAFAVGTLGSPEDRVPDGEWIGVTYNPYRDTTFVTRDEDRTPFHSSEYVVMNGTGPFPVVAAKKGT